MKLFDSHCHLDDAVFQPDFEKVLQRAAEAGVKRMMIAGIDEHTSARAVELAGSRPEIYASVGVHPHDARSCSEKTLTELSVLARHPKVAAWGEIGLDFNRMYAPQEDQEHWFLRQLEIADQLDLPLIFHERDSQGRFLEILEASPSPRRRAVVHCFSGSPSELDRYLDMGFYIGITGIATIAKRGRALRDMLPRIPQNRLLIETDAPYLTPTPQRNKYRRNEPAFVRQVLTKVAEVLDQELPSLAQQLWTNTCTLFRIDPSMD